MVERTRCHAFEGGKSSQDSWKSLEQYPTRFSIVAQGIALQRCRTLRLRATDQAGSTTKLATNPYQESANSYEKCSNLRLQWAGWATAPGEAATPVHEQEATPQHKRKPADQSRVGHDALNARRFDEVGRK
jgi:hypothetical protein